MVGLPLPAPPANPFPASFVGPLGARIGNAPRSLGSHTFFSAVAVVVVEAELDRPKILSRASPYFLSRSIRRDSSSCFDNVRVEGCGDGD